MQGLFQVGVEFEAPGNIWGLPSPPEDWRQFPVSTGFDPAGLEREMNRLLAVAEAGTHYQLLGVNGYSPRAQIKRNFYQLAQKFHPDRHMGRREWVATLHTLMDALTLAYRTLTDEPAREEYDRRLAESGAFALGPSKTEAQRSAEECLEKARELLGVENYVGSILWLRKAVEIEPDNSKYHALLARSLSAVPQYRREAIAQFERALELDPLNAWAHQHFGRLYEELKLPWRARPHYQKAVKLAPGDREARERLQALTTTELKEESSPVSWLQSLLSRLAR